MKFPGGFLVFMVYYLDPEFDPKKLTKAELRSIMASHGILDLPPPAAKKDELLDLFYREIIAKRKVILESQKNVKPKSDGIVFLDDSSRPSPKRPKKVKNKILEASEEIESIISSPEKNESTIERPETPLAVSTYKLVSRLENLQTSGAPTKRNIIPPRKNLIVKYTFYLIISVVAMAYFYFKFWFTWPIYTEEQLSNLENKPLLFLRCPYSKNSQIGSCSEGKLYCAVGYIETKNFLGFGSSCKIDKERLSLIQSIKKKIVLELQTRLGLNQCYQEPSSFVSKTALHDIIFKFFRNMNPKTFSEYFDICIRSLLQEGTQIDIQNRGEESFFKAREPIYTYYCGIKISLRKILEQRPFEVISGIFLAFIATILIFQYHGKQKQNRAIKHYYLLICKILKEQNAQHRCDPSISSFISTNQLRDAILIKCSSREKALLWPKIITEVSKNSNIVESITIFRGEQTRVWEWIGADVSL